MNARGVRTKSECCYFSRDAEGKAKDFLFDLRNDPYQLRNLSSHRPELVRALGAETKQWLRRMKDPFTNRKTRQAQFDSIPG